MKSGGAVLKMRERAREKERRSTPRERTDVHSEHRLHRSLALHTCIITRIHSPLPAEIRERERAQLGTSIRRLDDSILPSTWQSAGK